MSTEYPAPSTEKGSIVDAARDGYAARRPALESEDGRSLGELLGDVTSNLSTLMQQEMALAKAELRQSGAQAGKGIGMYAGAAVGALLLLVFLSLSVMWGVGQYIGKGWASLIIAVIWGIIAAVLMQAGKKELARVRGIPTTTETLSKVPNAVKGHEEENR
jgi:tetrahydromethanopterin S-methyltransferase subunit G